MFGAMLLLTSGLGLSLTGCEQVVQSEECKAYVACLKVRDTKLGIKTDALRFEASGACWGSPEGAGLCTHACKNGLTWLKQTYPSQTADCQ